MGGIMKIKLNILIALILFYAGLNYSQTLKKDDPKSWTIDDILDQERAGSFDISPDGKQVLWVNSKMDKAENKSISNVFLSSLTEEKTIQMTPG